MLLRVPNVLTPTQVSHARPPARAGVVDRRQGDCRPAVVSSQTESAAAGRLAAGARGWRNDRGRPAAQRALHVRRPSARVFPPLFNRYAGGQSFGTHVDNAIRQVPGTPHRIRTDLSATLFFVARRVRRRRAVVEDTYGVHPVKLPAGHMILYPSTSLHHVRPVTSGARVSSFFWIQSMVRDDGRAHPAVRPGHGHSAPRRRGPGPPLDRAADRRVPQPPATVGRIVDGKAQGSGLKAQARPWTTYSRVLLEP